MEVVAARMVCPSGGAAATMRCARLPPAPARFSTTTGCPRRSESFCPTNREMVSMKPPGANPTTIVMVLDGNCCARAICGVQSIKVQAAAASVALAKDKARRHPVFSAESFIACSNSLDGYRMAGRRTCRYRLLGSWLPRVSRCGPGIARLADALAVDFGREAEQFITRQEAQQEWVHAQLE